MNELNQETDSSQESTPSHWGNVSDITLHPDDHVSPSPSDKICDSQYKEDKNPENDPGCQESSAKAR